MDNPLSVPSKIDSKPLSGESDGSITSTASKVDNPKISNTNSHWNTSKSSKKH